MKTLLTLLISILLFTSCEKEEIEPQPEVSQAPDTCVPLAYKIVIENCVINEIFIKDSKKEEIQYSSVDDWQPFTKTFYYSGCIEEIYINNGYLHRCDTTRMYRNSVIKLYNFQTNEFIAKSNFQREYLCGDTVSLTYNDTMRL